jgi:hypothetical protein
VVVVEGVESMYACTHPHTHVRMHMRRVITCTPRHSEPLPMFFFYSFFFVVLKDTCFPLFSFEKMTTFF